MQENRLLYSSASNMMAVKHSTKSANAKNTVKAAALAPLAVVAVSMKSLKLLGTLNLEDPWNGYIRQKEAHDEIVNVQA